MAQTLHVAIFNTDIPVPSIATSVASTYGALFRALLSPALTRLFPSLKLVTTEYNTLTQEYPSPSTLPSIHLILITGSRNSAYDPLPWIDTLKTFIRSTYASHPSIKWFGSCFGHQILCQALLHPHGVLVLPSPSGYEIGVQTTHLHPAFRTHFSSSTGCPVPETLRLQYLHGDSVHIPADHTVPPSWHTVGETACCANQGMLQPGRVFTLQGHFEFDAFVNGETVKAFFEDRGEEWVAERLAEIEKGDDAEVVAEMVVRFAMLKGGGAEEGWGRVGGLVTPPEEEV
jgi:GMP synthase-like glutamine amidotransferase